MDYTSSKWQKGADSLRIASDAMKEIIEQALQNKTGALIGRQGSIELEAVLSFMLKQPASSSRDELLQNNAGIFPVSNERIFSAWRQEYLDSLKQADALAVGWYSQLASLEQQLLNHVAFHGVTIPLRALEPYYLSFDSGWQTTFNGRNITVVSSFTETMQRQNLNRVWPGADPTGLTTSKSVSFVRSFYSPTCATDGKCGWPNGIDDSIKALSFLEEQVLQTKCEIVLIGCGGIGMPLAARLKRHGMVCIVVGGAIQNLFGIRGKRWVKHDVISAFWNEDWVYPSKDEAPIGAQKIEGACYW